MKNYLIVVLLIMPLLTSAQQKHAYKVFNKEGEPATYFDILESASDSDIIFFGELHNNPVSHWLQIELTKDLYNTKKDKLILGAEMFESDDQIILDEYLNDIIAEKNFKEEAKLWNNYSTDYRPLVEFAKANTLKFIATNVPRRYASAINRGGFDALGNLSDMAYQFLPPLPIPYDPELPAYKAMLEMQGMPGHVNENLPKAQAIKDAAMAHFILQNYAENNTFLHFNGAYHSNNFEGIVWYLKQYGKSSGIMVITTVEQDEVETLEKEHYNSADYIIAVPTSMTKTY